MCCRLYTLREKKIIPLAGAVKLPNSTGMGWRGIKNWTNLYFFSIVAKSDSPIEPATLVCPFCQAGDVVESKQAFNQENPGGGGGGGGGEGGGVVGDRGGSSVGATDREMTKTEGKEEPEGEDSQVVFAF